MTSPVQRMFSVLLTILFILPSIAADARNAQSQIRDLLTEAEQQLHQTPWKSLGPATRALKLSEYQQDPIATANAHLVLGRAYIGLHEMGKALEHLLPALSTFAEYGLQKQEAQTRRRLGGLYVQLADYDRALSELNTALAIFQELPDLDGVSQTLNSLGVCYGNMGDLDKAREFYEQALLSFEQSNNTAGVATAHINIGEVHRLTGETEPALIHFTTALKLARSENYRQGIAGALLRRAQCYTGSGDLSKAWSDVAEAEKIATGAGLVNKLLDAQQLMTKIRERQGNETEAEQYRQRAAQTASLLAEKQEKDRIAQLQAQQEAAHAHDSDTGLVDTPAGPGKKQASDPSIIMAGLMLLIAGGCLVLLLVRRHRQSKKTGSGESSGTGSP